MGRRLAGAAEVPGDVRQAQRGLGVRLPDVRLPDIGLPPARVRRSRLDPARRSAEDHAFVGFTIPGTAPGARQRAVEMALARRAVVHALFPMTDTSAI
jgi:hypothetical protein